MDVLMSTKPLEVYVLKSGVRTVVCTGNAEAKRSCWRVESTLDALRLIAAGQMIPPIYPAEGEGK